MDKILEPYEVVSYCRKCLLARRNYNCEGCGEGTFDDIPLSEEQYSEAVDKWARGGELGQCVVNYFICYGEGNLYEILDESSRRTTDV